MEEGEAMTRVFQTYFDHELGTVVVPDGVCPYPIGEDDGSVEMCLARGHCGCRNDSATCLTQDFG